MTGSGELTRGGPRVVAIGGGHGLSRSLRAVRTYAGEITAIVSVADDGGSSGRLREELGIPAPGDVRRCLGALLPGPSPLGDALEHRFDSGELAGHAFGNLLIAALAATAGDFTGGVLESGRLLGALGRVLPATRTPVDLKALAEEGEVEGQVRIMRARGVSGISLVPPDPEPPEQAIEALVQADQIVIGPGSLYTSVLAACIVPELRAAMTNSGAGRVYVANLREQCPETQGYDVAAHVCALRRHGVNPDVVVADPDALELGSVPAGVRVLSRRVAEPSQVAHDPSLLGPVLAALA